MKRKSRDWDLTLELSCHAGCPTDMLMYLAFSNLNSIHWIRKKDIGLCVLFRTFHDNFQVKLFPPKIIFSKKKILIFVTYMLMYLRFSNLNSIHWIIKKYIGLYVLFRIFSGHFMTIFRSNYFHLKKFFLFFFYIR